MSCCWAGGLADWLADRRTGGLADWEAIQDLLVFPLVLLALAEFQTGGLAGGLADWRTGGPLADRLAD